MRTMLPRLRTRRGRFLILLTIAWVAAGVPADAEPLDLDDPTPRMILVRFESSSRAEPALLDSQYGPPLPARLHDDGAGLVRIVIEGNLVERYLFGTELARPGSFDDFVWLFDRQSGHVIDARFEGRIVQELDWGLMRSTTEATVRARMSTRERAGFRPPRRILGNRVFRYCDPSVLREKSCRAVEAVPFDRERGYVNAVGVIDVRTPLGIEARTFSPLGEAIFLEVDGADVSVILQQAGR